MIKTDNYEVAMILQKPVSDRSEAELKILQAAAFNEKSLDKRKVLNAEVEETSANLYSISGLDATGKIIGSNASDEVLKTDENIKEIAAFMERYIARVGENQAALDFQKGLNILNGYKPNKQGDEVEKTLKEDGDFGQKTKCCLVDACRHNPIEKVKEAVKLGVINNAIQRCAKENRREDIAKQLQQIDIDIPLKIANLKRVKRPIFNSENNEKQGGA